MNLEVVVRGQQVGQVYHLMGAPLRRHDDAADLFHLRIVRWAHAVQVASNLHTTTTRSSFTHVIHLPGHNTMPRHRIMRHIAFTCQISRRFVNSYNTATQKQLRVNVKISSLLFTRV